ncbi:unnamed protein product [Moneuplotes crassus]|uniref:Uncharacterized protein n=1 Tax=Euplotes crassus TaxID=5936 RepID=A0AAD1X6F1_EUPCR|nr:unnamed protein product [Moneuplotes crassus]
MSPLQLMIMEEVEKRVKEQEEREKNQIPHMVSSNKSPYLKPPHVSWTRREGVGNKEQLEEKWRFIVGSPPGNKNRGHTSVRPVMNRRKNPMTRASSHKSGLEYLLALKRTKTKHKSIPVRSPRLPNKMIDKRRKSRRYRIKMGKIDKKNSRNGKRGNPNKKNANVSFSDIESPKQRCIKGDGEFLKTMYGQETYNINEVSVRVDFDSDHSESEDDYFGGILSKNQFFDRYKNMSKIDRNKESPHLEYIKSCQEQGIVAMPYGMTKKKGKANELMLNDFLMGDKYAEAVSKILPFIKEPLPLNLRNNRLTQKGVDTIIGCWNENIREFDISLNPGIKKLDYRKLIGNRNFNLTNLALEGNRFGDKNIHDLCEAVLSRPILKVLNLSQNMITSKGGKSLAELIRYSDSIEELYLRWNFIRPRGGVEIIEALKENKSLITLEMSFNPLGENKKPLKKPIIDKSEYDPNMIADQDASKLLSKNYHNIAAKIGEMFEVNDTLLHADFSQCGFNIYECREIAEGLKRNHTLLGLHFMSQPMNVNALGFLKEADIDSAAIHLNTKFGGNNETGFAINEKIKLHSTSNCWVCEGWSKVTFKLDPKKVNNPPKESMTPKDKVYLNLSIDNFEPDPMEFDESTGTYSLDRMTPAIKMEYFFTINGVQKYLTNKPKKEPEDNDIDIVFANVVTNKIKKKVKLSHDYLLSLDCFPRPVRPGWPDDEKEEPKWDFEKSVFFGYKPDNDEILAKCFDYDWAHCKIPNIIKNLTEQAKVQKYLKANYGPIREVYKYFAGVSPCSNVPCISQNAFIEIINKTNIIDQKELKLSDIDLEFTATKAGNKKNKLNPDKWWLVRYQLMEILVRIALKKYYKPSKEGRTSEKITESEAVVKLFEDKLLPHFYNYNCHKWRLAHLWCQEIDEAFQEHLDEIDLLFKLNSGKYCKPGKSKFMSLDEFSQMITNSGILESKSLGSGEIGSLFNVSMMTQVKELEFERHMEMNFLEFVEAVCRVAFKLIDFPEKYLPSRYIKPQPGESKRGSKDLSQVDSMVSGMKKKENDDNVKQKVEQAKNTRSVKFLPIPDLSFHAKVSLLIKLLIRTSLSDQKISKKR